MMKGAQNLARSKNSLDKLKDKRYRGAKEFLAAILRETGTEISLSKLEQYKKYKLLPPPQVVNDEEIYGEEHLERVKTIEHLRSKYGMSLKDISSILSMVASFGEQEIVTPGESSKEISRKEQIIQNASVIFEAKGYDRTTIDDIAQAAGIAKGTFYIYFNNKEELLLEVIKKLINQTIESIEAKSTGEKDFFKRIIIKGIEFVNLYLSKRDLLFVLIGQTVGNPRLARQLEEIHLNLVGPVIDDLRFGIRKGQVRPLNDLKTIAYGMIGMGMMIAYRLSLDQNADFQKAIEEVDSFIKAALAKSP